MSIHQPVKKLLVLAPHTDDGEIGAGGLIKTFADAGVDIRYVAFSSCQESIPEHLPQDVLVEECNMATKALGLAQERVAIRPYSVRRFNESRQDLLDELVQERRIFDPDWVLTPSSHDVHQDHSVITMEAVRAFKDRTLLGYEMPWNCIDFRADFFFHLTGHALETKIMSIRCYESQSFRGYGDGEVLKNLARLRGSQVGVQYAEAFEVIRWVWLR